MLSRLEITYGDALAPQGFRKLTTSDGDVARVGTNAYLWSSNSGGTDSPILEIAIHDQAFSSSSPLGFERLERKIPLSSAEGAYCQMCFRRGKQDDSSGLLPIERLWILIGEVDKEAELEKEHQQAERLFIEEGVYLCILRFPSWVSGVEASAAASSTIKASGGSSTNLATASIAASCDDGGAAGVGGFISRKEVAAAAQAVESHKQKVSDASLVGDGDSASSFWQWALIFVQRALNMRLSTHELAPRLNALLRDVLEVAVISILQQTPKKRSKNAAASGIRLAVIEQILTGKAKEGSGTKMCFFYEHYGRGRYPEDDHLDAQDTNFVSHQAAQQQMTPYFYQMVRPTAASWLTLGLIRGENSTFSSLLISNLNFFSSLQGWDVLLAFHQSNGSLLQLLTLLNLVKVISPLATSDFALVFHTAMHRTVHKRLLALQSPCDYEELISDWSLCDKLARGADLLVSSGAASGSLALDELREEMNLSFAFQLVACGAPGMRDRGIKIFVDVADMAERRGREEEFPKSFYSGRIESGPATKWLTSDMIRRFLTSREVIDILLLEKEEEEGVESSRRRPIRHESLRSAVPLFCFMAEGDVLTKIHISCLWQLVALPPDQTESGTQSLALRILGALGKHLARDMLFYSCSQALSLQHLAAFFGVEHIKTLRALAIAMASAISSATTGGAGGESSTEGDTNDPFAMLLLCCKEESQWSKESGVAGLAAEYVASLIADNDSTAHLVMQLDKLLEDLYEQASTRKDAAICTLLAVLQGQTHRSTASRYCAEKPRIVETIFESISKCVLKEECDGNIGEREKKKKLVFRLQLLSQIAPHLPHDEQADAGFNMQHISAIWRIVSASGGDEIANTLLTWLSAALPDNHVLPTQPLVHFVKLGAASTLLDELSSSASSRFDEGSTISLAALCRRYDTAVLVFVDRLFRFVNFGVGHLSYPLHRSRANFTTESIEPKGVNLLLHVARTSTSKNTQDASIELMLDVYTNFNTKLDRRSAWLNFTEANMFHLKRCVEQNDEQGVREMEATLTILNRFLQRVVKPSVFSSFSLPKNSSKVIVFCKNEGASNESSSLYATSMSKTYFFPQSTTVGNLRSRLAKDLEHPVRQIRLLNGNKALLAFGHDGLTLAEACADSIVDAFLLREVQQGKFTPRQSATTCFEHPSSDEMAPHCLLVQNEEHEKLLSSLLSWPHVGVAEMAWTVLSFLPTSPGLKVLLRERPDGNDEEDSPNWSVVVGGPSFSTLMLRALRHVLEIAEYERSWRTMFVHTGGLWHLVQILFTVNIVDGSVGQRNYLYLHCVFLLVRAIVCIGSAPVDSPSFDEEESYDESSMKNLLSVLSRDELARLVACLPHIALMGFANDSDLKSKIDAGKGMSGGCGGNKGEEAPKLTKTANEEQPLLLFRQAMFLFHSIASILPEAANAALQSSGGVIGKQLLALLLGENRVVVRQELTKLTLGKGAGVEATVVGLLDVFIPNLNIVVGDAATLTCGEVFKLLVHLVGEQPTETAAERAAPLAETMRVAIINYRGTETHEENFDLLMRGRMKLLQAILKDLRTKKDYNSLILGEPMLELYTFLFNECLFGDAPRCKSLATRKWAVMLLRELAVCSEKSLQQALVLLSNQFSIVPQEGDLPLPDLPNYNVLEWNGEVGAASIDEPPSTERGRAIVRNALAQSDNETPLLPRSKYDFAGMANPGCVCYLISALQLFFVMPSFRQGVLQIAEEDLLGSDEDAADSFRQLQRLYVLLQETPRAYVDPRPFCASFRGYDGFPTNLSLQQDACEFITLFAQRVESALMVGRHHDLLQKAYQGEFEHELTGDRGRRSISSEPFTAVPIEIEKQSNVAESLASLITGEQVEYSWADEHCELNERGEIIKQSVLCTKSTRIKRLPRHLLLHLKRFQYDKKIFQHYKLNKRFEFPHTLDMWPYTVTAKQAATGEVEDSKRSVEDEQDYMYELTGIMLHSGSATSGHYYVIVRGENGQWFELNDGSVRVFDISKLDEEAFGGEEVTAPHMQQQVLGLAPATPVLKVRSAFVLLYNQVSSTQQYKGDSLFKATIPSPLTLYARLDKQRYFRSTHILTNEYLLFVNQVLLHLLVSPTSFSSSLSATKVSADFLFGTMLRLKATHQREPLKGTIDIIFPKLCSMLVSKLKIDSHISRYLLDTLSSEHGAPILRLALFGLESSKDAQSILSTILAAIRCLAAETNAQAIQLENESVSAASRYKLHPSLLLLERMLTIGGLFREAQIQWKRQTFYFAPIAQVALTAPAARAMLLRNGYLAQLLSFFLGNHTPYPELVGGCEPATHHSRAMGDVVPASGRGTSSDEVVVLGTSGARIDMRSLLQAIVALLPPHTRNVEESGSPRFRQQQADDPSALSNKERSMMESPLFMLRLMSQIRSSLPRHKLPVAELLERIVWGSRSVTTSCVDTIINGLKREDGNDVKPFFRAAVMLLEVQDQLIDFRVELLLTRLCAIMLANSKFVVVTEVSIEMYIRLLKASHKARIWTQRNYARHLQWAEGWLLARKRGNLPPNCTGTYKEVATKVKTTTTFASPNFVSSPAVALNVLKKIAAGEGVFDKYDVYDSDSSPTELLGKRIKVRWSEQAWYAGTVSSVRQHDAEDEDVEPIVTVTYDDGEVKTYDIKTKIWSFVREK